jgi:hypothetical protein
MANPIFARRIGRLFNTPINSEMGMSELFPYAGVIMSVDEKALLATVNTSNGIVTNVKIPILSYSPDTGIFHKPSAGDYCLVVSTARNEKYIIGFYSFNSIQELTNQNRVMPKEHTLVIKTKAGDTIQLSIDEATPTISVQSPKKLQLQVDLDKKSGIINIDSTDTDVTMKLSVVDNDKGKEKASIEFGTKTGDMTLRTENASIEMKNTGDTKIQAKDASIKMKNTGEIIVNNGDSPVVTLKMLEALVNHGTGSFQDGGTALTDAIIAEKKNPYKFKS